MSVRLHDEAIKRRANTYEGMNAGAKGCKAAVGKFIKHHEM